MQTWPSVGCSNLMATEMETTLDFIDSWDELDVDVDPRDVGGSPTSIDGLLECFGVEQTTATGCGASSSVNHTPQPSDTKKRKRQTPKQEIERLRQIESDLTRRLEILQIQAYNREQVHADSAPPSTSEGVPPYWKRTASRQYEKRVASERENARLKKVLKVRIAQAKRVKRILHELPGPSKW